MYILTRLLPSSPIIGQRVYDVRIQPEFTEIDVGETIKKPNAVYVHGLKAQHATMSVK